MRPKRIMAVLGLLIALLLSGCSALNGSDQSAGGLSSDPNDTSDDLTIKLLKLIDRAPFDMAQDQGYFRAEGLDIKESNGPKGSSNIDAVLGGDADIGMSSYPPAISAHDKMAKLNVVVDAVQTRPDSVILMVAANSPIKSLKDLEGKKVATSSKGGISEQAMTVHFRTHQVDASKVTFLSLEIAGMPSAVQRGDYAAAMIAEPHVRLATAQGMTKLYDVFSESTKDFPWSGLIAKADWVAANRDKVDKFRRAYYKGVEFARDHRDKVEAMLVKDLGIPPDLAPQTVFPEFPTSVDPVRLQRTVDLMRENGEKGADGQLINVDMNTMMIPAA